MGDFDCCVSGGCCREGADVSAAARKSVRLELDYVRDQYLRGEPIDIAALSIIDALIRRVERWDE